MRRLYIISLLLMLACIGCQWQVRSSEDEADEHRIVIDRYDRIERLYLTTADFAPLQQMKTHYPVQTRMLIEDVLRLGHVDEPDINTRFLRFFQDSTLQVLMEDVDRQYGDMSDLESQLSKAFHHLSQLLPTLQVPTVYAQIGSLDQSVIVRDGLLGISLDKYLGGDYPLYIRYGYSEIQRSMMDRQYIVPDCIGFCLLSQYPAVDGDEEVHIARIQYVVNLVINQPVFTREEVKEVERYMNQHREVTVEQLLRNEVNHHTDNHER